MSKGWLDEMDSDAAHEVINLLHALSDQIKQHDCPCADDIGRLDQYLTHQHSLAVQHAELLLEWMRDEGIDLSDRSARDALRFLHNNVPDKYLLVRDPRKST